MGKAVAYGDEWLGNESVGKREDEIAALPTGNQAVPTIEPDWDYNTAKGRWDQSHFVRCILEGLRQAHSKPLNYSKLADMEQEEKEAPGNFLDTLREAFHRFTEIDPESEEELKSFLMKMKEESEKNWLKTQHSETKTMASDPITSWQIEGETMVAYRFLKRQVRWSGIPISLRILHSLL